MFDSCALSQHSVDLWGDKYESATEDGEYSDYYDRDPLYHHVRVNYIEVIGETEKAICFKVLHLKKEICTWIPKSWLKNHDCKKKQVHIWKTGYYNNLVECYCYSPTAGGYFPKGKSL